jgi:hypothetical protein
MLNVQNVELKQTRFYQEIAIEERQVLLQRQLKRKFGSLPEWVQKRLLDANAEQLDQWIDRLLDVEPTLESIFEDCLH